MAFSLAPVGSRRFFFTIASAARSLCTSMTNKTKHMKKKKKKKKKNMGFGFFKQPSKFFHTIYFQYKDLYLSRFRESRHGCLI